VDYSERILIAEELNGLAAEARLEQAETLFR